MSFYIGGDEIGLDVQPYIIAELSANHKNYKESALKLTQIAKQSGANAVKLQTYA